MTRSVALLFLALLAFTSVPTVSAHEAHRKDMSDAEMAEMEQAAEDRHEGETEATEDAQRSPNAKNGEDAAFSLTDLLGRLHPALVHFPVALFLIAGLAELLLLMRPASGLEPTVRFLIYTGAAGGMVAASLGWFAAGFRLSDRSETLGLHRWTGTGIALAGVVAAIVVYRTESSRILLRLLLAGLAIALIFQGYWGGELSLGPNHLNL